MLEKNYAFKFFWQCYKEATDEQRAGLTLDLAFMAEVEQLKKAYNGEVFCLRISIYLVKFLID